MSRRIKGQRYFGYEQATNRSGGLLGHWIGDGAGLTLRNRRGFGADGVLTSGPLWTLGHEQQRHAVQFDGVNDFVDCPTFPSANTLPKVSIAAWVRMTGGTAGQRRIYDKRAGSLGMVFYLNNTGTIGFYVDFSGTDLSVVSTDTIPANEWVHVAVTWNGALASAGNVFMFINGRPVNAYGTQTTATLVQSDDSARNIQIGGTSGTTAWFGGVIDDLRLYNRDLANSEIVAIYQESARVIQPMKPRRYALASAAQFFAALVAIVTVTATTPTFAPGAVSFAPAVAVISGVAAVATFIGGAFIWGVASAIVSVIAATVVFFDPAQQGGNTFRRPFFQRRRVF